MKQVTYQIIISNGIHGEDHSFVTSLTGHDDITIEEVLNTAKTFLNDERERFPNYFVKTLRYIGETMK